MRLFLTVLFYLVAEFAAQAHPSATSSLMLHMSPATIEGELLLPLDQLQMANPQWPQITKDSLQPENSATLSHYLQQHMQFSTTEGQTVPWSVNDLQFQMNDSQPYVRVTIGVTLAEKAQHSDIRLDYDVIMHRVRNHQTLVSVNQDFSQTIFPDKPLMVGTFRYKHNQLLLPRHQRSLWNGFVAMFKYGVQHIAEGSDHLLFLLCLLLPAPLVYQAQQHRERVSVKVCVRHIAKIVAAFTLGHSLTLALGAFSFLLIPSKPVGILVAVSIIVAATGVVRAVTEKQALVTAAVFGLIHGLAFSATLTELGFDSVNLLVALLGFNSGIEICQLLIVAAVMPWLYILAASRWYVYLSYAGALVAAFAALGWILLRAFNWQTLLAELADSLLMVGYLLYPLLVTVAVMVWCVKRQASQPKLAKLPG